MKDYIFTFIVVAGMAAWGAKEKMVAEAAMPSYSMPAVARPLPGGGENWRSPQPDSAQMDSALSSGRVRLVIRLNGDGLDAGPLSISKEESQCLFYQVPFTRLDVTQPGALNWLHGQFILGGVYVHCRHGFDRTGAAVGFHLRTQGFSDELILEHNGWQNKGEAYQVYWDLAFGKKRRT